MKLKPDLGASYIWPEKWSGSILQPGHTRGKQGYGCHHSPKEEIRHKMTSLKSIELSKAFYELNNSTTGSWQWLQHCKLSQERVVGR